MSPELVAILAVGVALAGIVLNGQRALRRDLERNQAAFEQRLEQRLTVIDHRLAALEQRMDAFEQRMDAFEQRLGALEQRFAHQDGLLEGLREAIVAGARRGAAE